MKRTVLATAVIAVCLVACFGPSKPKPVETPDAAIAAAKGAFRSIHEKAPSQSGYSPENVERFEPFTATLRDGSWEVTGTRPAGYQGRMPRARVSHADGSVSATADYEDMRQ
jgi:hypothetical protein